MSVTKWNSATGLLLSGAAALAMSSQAAMAAQTTLVCNNDTRPDFEGMTVALDEARGTVTFNHPAHTIGRIPHTFPARSDGPFAATFDSKTITVDIPTYTSGDGIINYSHYTIDRVTADLLQFDSSNAPFDQAAERDKVMYHFTCHVARALF